MGSGGAVCLHFALLLHCDVAMVFFFSGCSPQAPGGNGVLLTRCRAQWASSGNVTEIKGQLGHCEKLVMGGIKKELNSVGGSSDLTTSSYTYEWNVNVSVECSLVGSIFSHLAADSVLVHHRIWSLGFVKLSEFYSWELGEVFSTQNSSSFKD